MNRFILSAVAALLAELFQDIRPDLQDASAFFLEFWFNPESTVLSILRAICLGMTPANNPGYTRICFVDPSPPRPPRGGHHYRAHPTASPEIHRPTGTMRTP